MHRTLKEQTSAPPAGNPTEQQTRFDAFRRHYNEERPHEALGQRPPAELYTPSPRTMPSRVEEPWYDAEHQVRRVVSVRYEPSNALDIVRRWVLLARVATR